MPRRHALSRLPRSTEDNPYVPSTVALSCNRDLAPAVRLPAALDTEDARIDFAWAPSVPSAERGFGRSAPRPADVPVAPSGRHIHQPPPRRLLHGGVYASNQAHWQDHMATEPLYRSVFGHEDPWPRPQFPPPSPRAAPSTKSLALAAAGRRGGMLPPATRERGASAQKSLMELKSECRQSWRDGEASHWTWKLPDA